MEHIETKTAELLVALASDTVSDYYDVEDWDAGIVAVLGRAMELATGRKLKPLEEIFWTTTTS